MPKKRRRNKEPKYAAPKPTIDELLASRSRLNRVSADFLKVDIETALTFASLALQTGNSEKKQRNCRAARKAYDTVVSLIDRVTLDQNDAQFLSRNLRRLKSELVQLGEVF